MKNILKYFRKERRLCISFLVMGLIITVLGLFEPKMTANMVEALTKSNLDSMMKFAIIGSVIAIVLAVVKFRVRNTAVSIRASVGKELEKDLCKRALNIKQVFLSEFKTGELSQITKEDSTKFLFNFQETVMQVFNIITSVAVAIYVLLLNWQAFVLFGIFFIVILFLQKKSLKKEKEGSESEKENNDSAKSLINQIYKGLQDIKVLNLKKPIFERYDWLLDKEIKAGISKEKAKSSNRLFGNISFEIYEIMFIIFGIFMMRHNWMAMDVFITIFMYKWRLYSLLFDIMEMRSNCKEMSVLAERMNKLLLIEDYKLENFGNINGSSLDSHKIEVADLTFSYGNNENVLENVSFKVGEGEVIGVAGASGSAKTTLIKLISRQLEPNSGIIKIDGIDISEFSEEGFTNMVSLVSQDPYIFSLSIRENLLLVKPNATEAEMLKALEEANILYFVKSLPNGLDTVLTENLEVSGGQKQRLAIARVFLKNTPIVLLDEATSAVDNETQADITDLIKSKAKKDGKIFICIAHRIEAIREADRILFLEDGRIANAGTHKQLLQDSRYVNLFKIINIA